MTGTEILNELTSLGVTVQVAGGDVFIRAPRGVLTADLVSRARREKLEIRRALAAPTAKMTSSPAEVVPEHLSDVTIAGQCHAVTTWDGRPLVGGWLGVDTETEIIESRATIPRLALMSVSAGNGAVLVKPVQVADFVALHADRHWFFHNVAFDFWVLNTILQAAGRVDEIEALWELADTGRLHDTMLLDSLINIARQGQSIRRNLAEVAQEWAGVTELNKDDPFRLRYGELIDMSWDGVERGFFEYAGKDSIATLLAARALWKAALNNAATVATDAIPHALTHFGPLTERVQVKASIALAAIGHTGFQIDRARMVECRERLERRRDRIAQRLIQRHGAGEMFVVNDGQLALTPSGQLKTSTSYLQRRLDQELGDARQAAELPDVPRVASGGLSTDADAWQPYRAHSTFVHLWRALKETSKLIQFTSDPGSDRVHSRYETLVDTGRTACSGPNLQQVPRDPRIRSCFVAAPGHRLVVADYGFIELVTLAATCSKRFGFSRLAEVIRDGIDPHAHTAAIISNMALDAFMTLKSNDPARFKSLRQKAKPINFGVPGGFQAQGLVTYARSTYGVEMTLEEAAALRDRLITEIYPELELYLEDDVMAVVAGNLGCTADELWTSLAPDERREGWMPWAVKRVVAGEPKKDGTAYNKHFVGRVWRAMEATCRKPELRARLSSRQPDPQLAADLFEQRAVVLTGRTRGRLRSTQVWNSPFQGLAADGGKLALYELVRAGHRVVAYVHDEVIVEAPCDRAVAVKEEVVRVMAAAMRSVLGVDLPVKVDAVVTDHWEKS